MKEESDEAEREAFVVNKIFIFSEVAMYTKSADALVSEDLEKKDALGCIPLLLAIKNNDDLLVQKLISAGANVHAVDIQGMTPLMWAVKLGNITAVRQLLACPGIDVNQRSSKDPSARTALYLAVTSPSPNMTILEALLENGADPNFTYENKHTVLMLAAIFCNHKVVHLLLQYRADPNAEDKMKNTAIGLASYGNNKDIHVIESLCQFGAEVNHENILGCTALHYAVRRDNLPLIKALIKNGADVNHKGDFSETPLDLTDPFSYSKAYELLREHGANHSLFERLTDISFLIIESPLFLAGALIASAYALLKAPFDNGALLGRVYSVVKNGLKTFGSLIFSDVIDMFSGNVASSDNQSDKKSAGVFKDKNGKPQESEMGQSYATIVDAVEAKDVLAVQSMSDNLINHTNIKGESLLTIAIKNRDLAMIELLVRKGMDVNFQEFSGMTPLMWAVQIGDLDIVAYFLAQEGIQVNSVNKSSESALHFAVSDSAPNITIIKMLLKHGADVNRVDENGKTGLMIAARKGQASVIHMLLAHDHIDVNMCDLQGNTALMYAVQQDFFSEGLIWEQHVDISRLSTLHNDSMYSMVTMLCENGAHVDAANDKGYTALHIASEMDNLPLVNALIFQQADVNQKTKSGRTPLDLNPLGVISPREEGVPERLRTCGAEYSPLERVQAGVFKLFFLPIAIFAAIEFFVIAILALPFTREILRDTIKTSVEFVRECALLVVSNKGNGMAQRSNAPKLEEIPRLFEHSEMGGKAGRIEVIALQDLSNVRQDSELDVEFSRVDRSKGSVRN